MAYGNTNMASTSTASSPGTNCSPWLTLMRFICCIPLMDTTTHGWEAFPWVVGILMVSLHTSHRYCLPPTGLSSMDGAAIRGWEVLSIDKRNF